MRIVHMTDVHFYDPPGLRAAVGKRALGLVNLYVVGRVRYFDPSEVVQRAVADALTVKPDLFVMTGDMTAMSSRSEFELARAAFAPLLDSVPSVVIPGNHDLYTRGARRDARMEQWFRPFMAGGRWADGAWRSGNGDGDGGDWGDGDGSRNGDGGDGDGARRYRAARRDRATATGPVDFPTRFRLGDVDVIATNPCRPVFRSSGLYPPGAIDRAEALVKDSREAGRQVVYLLHYPPLQRDGEPYRREGHCLEDVDALLASLRRTPPDLILHGHKHECWRVDLVANDGRAVPIVNCGSTSAVSPMSNRAAGYFVYELEGGALRDVRRRILLQDGAGFEDHPGRFGVAEPSSPSPPGDDPAPPSAASPS